METLSLLEFFGMHECNERFSKVKYFKDSRFPQSQTNLGQHQVQMHL